MRNYRRYLAKRGFSWEQAWTLEQGAAGNLHVHVLQKGDYVPQTVAQEVWGGIVNIKAVKGARGAAGYALKEAQRVSGYALKDADGDGLVGHLDLNGGRLVHLSRGYLGGETQAQVRARLVAAAREGEPDEWRRVARAA